MMKKEKVILSISFALCLVFLVACAYSFVIKQEAQKYSKMLEDSIKQMEEQNSSLVKTVKKLEESKKSLETQLKDKEEYVKLLIAGADKRNNLLLASINDKDKEIAGLKNESTKYMQDNKKLLAQLEMMRAEITNLRTQIVTPPPPPPPAPKTEAGKPAPAPQQKVETTTKANVKK